MNNKGYMLVEVILASVIALAIAGFIINMTIKLKNKNDDSMVETLVATDQAIATNKIMEIAMSEKEKFDCSKLKVDSANNLIIYNNKTLVVFSKYAKLTNSLCKPQDGSVIVEINVDVPQMPNKDFDISINYKYRISNMKVPEVKLNITNGSKYTTTGNKKVEIKISDSDGVRGGNNYKFKYAWSEKTVSCDKMTSQFTVNIPSGQKAITLDITSKLTNINNTLNGKGTLYICNSDGISDAIGNVLPTSIVSATMWLDNTAPTCTLSVDKNTDKIILTKSDIHSGIGEFGIATSQTVQYNGSESVDIGYNTFYGYVKDKASLSGSCKLEVIAPNKTTCSSGYTKYTAKNKSIYCYK